MPRYARETTVPVERSRAEIEETLRRYNASEFHSGWKADAAMIAFRLGTLFIRFVLPLPSQAERRFTYKRDRHGHEQRRTELQATREWDQEIRTRWRALLLCIKGKLEAVECGISTIEEEFLAHIVTDTGATVGEWILDQGRLGQLTARVNSSHLLPGPGTTATPADIVDAEFEEKS